MQMVKDQGQMRSELDLETWHCSRPDPNGQVTFLVCVLQWTVYKFSVELCAHFTYHSVHRACTVISIDLVPLSVWWNNFVGDNTV